MTKCLVTGGAGFIGSHVVDALIKSGHNTYVLDDLSGGKTDNINKGAHFVLGSITDHKLVDYLFDKEKFDYVFHLAAYAAEGLSHFIKRFNYTNNLIGSINLINAAINSESVKCFVFTSSIAVYGKNQVPMSEDMTPQPEDPYGISKYAIELDLKESHEMFGLNYIIFRPHNVYGERQNIGDRYRNVIGIFMNQIMQNKPMTIFGNGKQSRAFSYISDVAPAIAQSVLRDECYNKIFNIGADKSYTVLQLAHVVADVMGVQAEILYLEPRNEVEHAFSSHQKAKMFFGDLIKDVSLEVGIKRMADWAKIVGCQESNKFDEIEVHKNLPVSWQLLANPEERTKKL
jgi:UDP-glucose 4-epimerase